VSPVSVMVGRNCWTAWFSWPWIDFSSASASFRPRLFVRPMAMASSRESLRASSLAGWAVTLPKKGLTAEVGLGACAAAAAPEAARMRTAKKAGADAGSKTGFGAGFTSTLFQMREAGEGIPGRDGTQRENTGGRGFSVFYT